MDLHSPIVVTGSGGFVGRALLGRLGARPEALHFSAIDWRERLEATRFEGATVFHLAARVHSMEDADEAAHMRDNRDKTLALAQAAARGGARRLVFVSSVKAMAEETSDTPLQVDDEPRPRDAYGRSKLAAERAIAEAARGTRLEYAVVRAPLVLGAGAKANLASLLRICDSPWPLPFGALHNRRSFVHVDDLVRLLVECARSPEAAGRTYLAAHRETFSTARLAAAVRGALGRPARLFRVPPAWLEQFAALTGQGEATRRATRSLEVDPSAAERELAWRAQVSLEPAVEDMVSAYRAERAA